MKNTDDADLVPRPTWLLTVAVLLAVTAIYIAMRMPGALKSFHSIFIDLGLAPTRSAELLFSVPGPWWVFALASVAALAWIAMRSRVSPSEKRNMKLALVATFAMIVLAYGFVAFAIYPPLFELSATV